MTVDSRGESGGFDAGFGEDSPRALIEAMRQAESLADWERLLELTEYATDLSAVSDRELLVISEYKVKALLALSEWDEAERAIREACRIPGVRAPGRIKAVVKTALFGDDYRVEKFCGIVDALEQDISAVQAEAAEDVERDELLPVLAEQSAVNPLPEAVPPQAVETPAEPQQASSIDAHVRSALSEFDLIPDDIVDGDPLAFEQGVTTVPATGETAVSVPPASADARFVAPRDVEPLSQHDEAGMTPLASPNGNMNDSRARQTVEREVDLDSDEDLYHPEDEAPSVLERPEIIASTHIRAFPEYADTQGQVDLPLLGDQELSDPERVHRFIVSHPGEAGMSILQRFAEAEAERLSETDLEGLLDQGLTFMGMEEFELAVTTLLPAAVVDSPVRISATEALASCLFQLGRLADARAYLLGVLSHWPTDPQYAGIFYWLGQVAEEMGDLGSARTYYSFALQLMPDLVEAKRRASVLFR